ncbi:MAG: GNAT family N-acetyltransferase [Nocardioides sp.]
MIEVSTDPARLDVGRIHQWLSRDAYWALGRSLDVVRRAISGSLNVGAYDGAEQVGYARVVTDRATFAWLCDVYVDPSHRGAGVGTALLDAVDAELDPMGLTRTLLATADAHDLYARRGFQQLPADGRFMVRGSNGP